MSKYVMNLTQYQRYCAIINYAFKDKKFERLIVIMEMKYKLRWTWRIPDYLYNAVGDIAKFTEAAERWLSVNDCGAYIRPYIKLFVYNLHGAQSLQCKVLWETIPLELTKWGPCRFLHPHTTEVYEWLNENVSLSKGELPKLVLEDELLTD
jgi:hypothetical protein